MEKKGKLAGLLILGFLIGFLPTVWGIVATAAGVKTGTVALIAAGIFAANGNKYEDAIKVILGFWLGDLWSVLTVLMMGNIGINPIAANFIVFIPMAMIAVAIGAIGNKIFYLPSILVGWAIGLTFIGTPGAKIGTYPIQVAISELVGVLVVGIGVDLIQKSLVKPFVKKEA